MAYEGEPHEVAENFKNQGNDLFTVKRFREARDIYNKGIEIKCENDKINEALFANRAACQLELKNYRSCINDCKHALTLNPKNIKCYYRMGKAFYLLNNIEEAKESVGFGQKVDKENKSLITLLEVIEKKDKEIKEKEAKVLREKQERKNFKIILDNAMGLRHITNINSSHPPDLLKDAKIRLEDPIDFESQLIYPALIMYPTTDEFDFVAEISELTTVQELLELILERPQEWFELPGHKNFTSKKLIAYMETETGGLIKAGKKMTFHDILKKDSPNIPLFDNSLKIYFVPKIESESWLAKWDKQKASFRE